MYSSPNWLFRARRRRRYGRGPNKYDRTWEDEEAYSRPRGRGGASTGQRGGPSFRGTERSERVERDGGSERGGGAERGAERGSRPRPTLRIDSRTMVLKILSSKTLSITHDSVIPSRI